MKQFEKMIEDFFLQLGALWIIGFGILLIIGSLIALEIPEALFIMLIVALAYMIV